MTATNDNAPVETEARRFTTTRSSAAAQTAASAAYDNAPDGIAIASAIDRAWFAAHPQRRAYRRPALPGEFGEAAHNLAGHWVLVRQAAPGIRRKTLLCPMRGAR